ncbi:MAG: hypothetical protein ACC700_12755 [Anaerolineales bacterium]
MEKALSNLESHLGRINRDGWYFGNKISTWRKFFQIIEPMLGAKGKLDDIANEHDNEQLMDLLAEVKYAVIFAQLGFHVDVEPVGCKQQETGGPDLRITRDNRSSPVEVKRFRSLGRHSPGQRLQRIPDEIPETYRLPAYGDLSKDINKVSTEIENKFRQAGPAGIIAIWNSNDELSPDEVGTAAFRLKTQSNHPRKSSFILLRGDPGERFSCFKLQDTLMPYHKHWIDEFKQVAPDGFLSRP